MLYLSKVAIFWDLSFWRVQWFLLGKLAIFLCFVRFEKTLVLKDMNMTHFYTFQRGIEMLSRDLSWFSLGSCTSTNDIYTTVRFCICSKSPLNNTTFVTSSCFHLSMTTQAAFITGKICGIYKHFYLCVIFGFSRMLPVYCTCKLAGCN